MSLSPLPEARAGLTDARLRALLTPPDRRGERENKEILEAARDFECWAKLGMKTKRQICASLQFQLYRKGEDITFEGAAASHSYIVMDGLVVLHNLYQAEPASSDDDEPKHLRARPRLSTFVAASRSNRSSKVSFSTPPRSPVARERKNSTTVSLIQARRHGSDRREQLRLGPGEVFGLELVEDGRHVMGARALGPTVLGKLARDAALRLLPLGALEAEIKQRRELRGSLSRGPPAIGSAATDLRAARASTRAATRGALQDRHARYQGLHHSGRRVRGVRRGGQSRSDSDRPVRAGHCPTHPGPGRAHPRRAP